MHKKSLSIFFVKNWKSLRKKLGQLQNKKYSFLRQITKKFDIFFVLCLFLSQLEPKIIEHCSNNIFPNLTIFKWMKIYY